MTELAGFHKFALAGHVHLRSTQEYLQAVRDFLDWYSKGRAKYYGLIQLFSEELKFAHWIQKCPAHGSDNSFDR